MMATKLMTIPLTNPHCLYLYQQKRSQSKEFSSFFNQTFVYVHED